MPGAGRPPAPLPGKVVSAVCAPGPHDPSDQALLAHARRAKALGMCPQLHKLAADGTCPEGCAVPDDDNGHAATTASNTGSPDSHPSSSAFIASALLVP